MSKNYKELSFGTQEEFDLTILEFLENEPYSEKDFDEFLNYNYQVKKRANQI